MYKLYRFSPIENKNSLLEAIQYVAKETKALCKKTIGKELPISSLTIFSHYSDEFENLKNIAYKMGSAVGENNGPFIKLKKPIKLPNGYLDILRIRQPDPYRMQVGCNDFEVNDYKPFKAKFFDKNNKNLRLIERPGFETIEFMDPDFDVLSYIFSMDLVIEAI